MHIILSWLRLGDGSPVPRIPIFFSLKNAGAQVPATPSKNCLTASITVGHATGREHVQVVVPTVKGAFGIQGWHWFDSNASHSAPSTRQDGAHNAKQAKEKAYEQ